MVVLALSHSFTTSLNPRWRSGWAESIFRILFLR